MAKSKNNVVTRGLSGKIDNMLVFSQRCGKTIVSSISEKPRKQSEKQKAQVKRFQHASLYATAAQVSPEYKDVAAKKGKTPYIVAVADFLNAPDIELMDVSAYAGQPGDVIRIRVMDDFAVKAVVIRITNDDGSLVEEGNATPDTIGYEWTFTATVNNDNLQGDKIEVFASDTPGNITQEERVLQ